MQPIANQAYSIVSTKTIALIGYSVLPLKTEPEGFSKNSEILTNNLFEETK